MNTRLIDGLGWILVHSLWQFIAIGCLVWLVDHSLKRRSSAVRYNVLSLAMLCMAFCPIVTATAVFQAQTPTVAYAPTQPSPDLQVSGSGEISRPIVREPEGDDNPQVASVSPLRKNDADALNAESGRTVLWSDPRFAVRQIAVWIEPCLGLAVSAWCVGVLFFASRLSVGWWRIRCLLGRSAAVTDPSLQSHLLHAAQTLGIRRKLQLRVSGSIESPIVVGVVRSTIVIPTSFSSGMSPDLVEAIFAHELAHVRRYDYLINLIQSVLEAVFFYHPIIWWLSDRIREERENCCDDIAVAAMRSPVTVSRALLAMEELRGQSRSPALAAASGSLSARIRRLLGKQPDRKISRNAVSLVSLGLLIAVLASVAGLTIATAAPPAGAEENSAESDALDAVVFDDGKVLPNLLLSESRSVHSIQLEDESTMHSVAYGEGDAKPGRYPRIRRWDLTTKEMRSEIPLQWENEWTRYTSQLVLSADLELVYGSLGNELGVWDTKTGRLLRRMKPKWEEFGDLSLHHILVTPSGERVACTGMSNSTRMLPNGHLYIWDANSGQMVQEITSEQTGYPRSFALSDDGRYVAAWPAQGGVGIWDVDNGEQIFSFKNENPPGSWPGEPMHPSIPDQVLGLQFSHDGQTLAIGDLVGVKLIDIPTGDVKRALRAPLRYNSPTLVFSPDDRLLLRYGAYLENRRESLLWDVETGDQIAILPIEGSAAAFSPNGDKLAMGRSDRKQAIAVWNLQTDSEADQALTLPWRAFGRVVDGDGKPLTGVTIRAATGMGTLLGGGQTTTNADGRYDFRFGMGIRMANNDGTPHPQTQVAQVTAHLDGHFEENFSRHGSGIGSLQPVAAEDLEYWGVQTDQIVLPERPREVNFVMLPAASVRGTLIDSEAKPLANYSVSLTADALPPGSSVLSQVRTDAEGRFAITEIPTTIPYQFIVRKPRDQLAPPWDDSWASGPIAFRPPGDADIAWATPPLQATERSGRFSVDRFRIQIQGPGVHGKTAVKRAADDSILVNDPEVEPTRDAISRDRFTLTLKN